MAHPNLAAEIGKWQHEITKPTLLCTTIYTVLSVATLFVPYTNTMMYLYSCLKELRNGTQKKKKRKHNTVCGRGFRWL